MKTERVSALLPSDPITIKEKRETSRFILAQIKKLIEETLREAGIEIRIDGCGHCGSPWLEVYKLRNLPDHTEFFEGVVIDSRRNEQ